LASEVGSLRPNKICATERKSGMPRKKKSTAMPKQTPLERYITVLETVASAPDANLSDLAGLCRLPFSSMHRALHTLLRLKLVVPAAGRRGAYSLGPRLLRLLHAGLDEAWLRIKGQQILDELASQLNDTCFINKLVAKEVITVAWAAPENGARGYLVPGLTQPPHASASAKAILAYQPLSFIRKALPERLPKLCTKTKTKLKDVLADFEQVRARGYATCWNEYEQGVGAIACPVLIPDADVIYSVGITGLIDRLSRPPIDRYVDIIRYSADAIAQAIRHQHQNNGNPARELESVVSRALEIRRARPRSTKVA
jgi:DNA-binding IclR family transcriptional regulator